jgi:hypothetical protein
VDINILEEPAASIFRVEEFLEEGSITSWYSISLITHCPENLKSHKI